MGSQRFEESTAFEKIAIVAVVTSQSQTVEMFVNTYPGELSSHYSIRNVYVVQENIHLHKVFRSRKMFFLKNLKACSICSFNFSEKKLNTFEFWYSSLSFPFKFKKRTLNEHRFSIWDSLL